MKKLGRITDFPADADKQFHQRIVPLRQIGFGPTLNHILMFAVQIRKEHSMQNPWKGRVSEKG
jgi:hypothetical protein